MIDYFEYDKKVAENYLRDLDKHNGYTFFLGFVSKIILENKPLQNINPSIHAAKYVLDYYKKKGIEFTKENLFSSYNEINIQLGGVKAAAEAFPQDTSFEEIAKLSESVLSEGLKPWNPDFMKSVWEKKNKEK
ncbi:MAG: hypothetical protein WA139_03270 [Candidatus Aenigmatarchaeota archaeon]